MLATTFAGTSVFLLNTEPVGAVQISVSRLTERHAGRTRREERRALGATLRWKLDFPIAIDDRTEAQVFRAALQDFDNRPILCPLWPAARPYGSVSLFTGGLLVTWEPDWTQWALHTTPTPGFTPSADARTAPVLWGRFDKLPDPNLVTTEALAATISFVETGPATYAVAPAASIVPHTGPELHDIEWPLLDFELDYEKINSGGVEIQIDRERIGYGRGEAETFYPQTPRRQVKCTVVADTAAEAARLIATFHASGGTVSPVWFPSGVSPTRLLVDTSAGNTYVKVESVAALGGHPHILLRDATSGAAVACTIASTSGDNWLILEEAPGNFHAEAISLQFLLFGRFLSDELTLTWTSPLQITAQFTLTELPPDYGAPAGEVYGESLGNVGSPIFLFEIADQIGGTWYWTNYESAITITGVGGHTYTPQQIAWDKISQGLNLDDGKLTLTMDSWVGNPFLRLTVPRRGQQLTLVLKEWDAAGTTSPLVIWRGYASSAKASAKILKIPCVGEGRSFELRIPRRIDGPTCPWVIYGVGCGLNPNNFDVAATAVSEPAALQLQVALSGSFSAHYFNGGWAARTVPGEGSPTYAILESTVSSGGMLTLTLDMPISPELEDNEAWTLYPGCDCTFAACTALNNTGNFGGAPRKPAANPAFVAVKQGTSPTSKK
ncbi:MAG: phage BR0599 family protein [Opitutaceae bacterium]|jgi:hypothetical protein